MWKEKGQLHFCAFLLDPDSQMCSLAFHGGIEAQFPGDRARAGFGPLHLVGRSGAAMAQRPRKKGWEVSSQWATLLRGKKDYSFLCPGLVGWLGAQIELMNNLQRLLTFFRVKSYRKVRRQRGMHPIYLPCSFIGPHFLSCFIICIKGEFSHHWHFNPKPLKPAST